ncbi:MAG TPA: response regulator [Terracidiphilus sp.]|jgi:CheY-like chemotaxis protein|nr:response regulator [Terracidiphilus sp.]
MTLNPRVLIVDDDQVIATTLSMILNRSGFVAVEAFSGPQALELARVSSFDILVTDVMMEPMNGVELAKAFCEIYPEAQIFLISGTTEAAATVLADFECEQAFPLLKKPIYPGDLIELLRVRSSSSASL